MDVINRTIETWHGILKSGQISQLEELLTEDSVFHSPVLADPQKGRPLVQAYLTAAYRVLGRSDFNYVRQILSGHDAMLEFTARIDGHDVNGVDIIRCNDEGLIIDFKVMLRPQPVLEILRKKMRRELVTLAREGRTA